MLASELDPRLGPTPLVLPLKRASDARQFVQTGTALLLVRGMTCPGCALHVRDALLQIPGVTAADVALRRGLARVWYDPDMIRPEMLANQLAALVVDAAYHYTAHLVVIAGDVAGAK